MKVCHRLIFSGFHSSEGPTHLLIKYCLKKSAENGDRKPDSTEAKSNGPVKEWKLCETFGYPNRGI